MEKERIREKYFRALKLCQFSASVDAFDVDDEKITFESEKECNGKSFSRIMYDGKEIGTLYEREINLFLPIFTIFTTKSENISDKDSDYFFQDEVPLMKFGKLSELLKYKGII